MFARLAQYDVTLTRQVIRLGRLAHLYAPIRSSVLETAIHMFSAVTRHSPAIARSLRSVLT